MEKLCTQEDEEEGRSVAFKLRREEHVRIAACALPFASLLNRQLDYYSSDSIFCLSWLDHAVRGSAVAHAAPDR
jgi:hypothetical protein